MRRTLLTLGCLALLSPRLPADAPPKTLPGSKPLTMSGDIASSLVEGVDKFLLREIDSSVKGREKFFKRDLTSVSNASKALEPNRHRLAHILGLREERPRLPEAP